MEVFYSFPHLTLAFSHFHANFPAHFPDPISNLTVLTPDWANLHEDFPVSITCNGSAQFEYCIRYMNSAYVLIGDETCDTWTMLEQCKHNSTLVYSNTNEDAFALLVIVRNAVSIERQVAYVRVKQSIILVAAVVGIFVFALGLIMALICCILQCCRKRKR